MGKKRVSFIGTENEEEAKSKATVKREQKKLREGKTVTKPSEEPQIIQEPQEKPKPSKKSRVRSKSYTTAKSKVDPEKHYPLPEALKLLREVSLAKFDATVELHLTLQNGLPAGRQVDLPHSTGKTRRVAIATDDTIKSIEAGKIDFDVLFASPDQMGKLVKFAKVLGPRGLMPNPKNGTVVSDPQSAQRSLMSKNSIPLKTESGAPLIHTIAGKLSMSDTHLSANIEAILSTFTPTDLKKVVLKSTISPAIKLVV